jgi:hypothetical protein
MKHSKHCLSQVITINVNSSKSHRQYVPFCVSFLIAVTNYLKNNLKEEKYFGSVSEVLLHRGREGVAKQRSSRSREIQEQARYSPNDAPQ